MRQAFRIILLALIWLGSSCVSTVPADTSGETETMREVAVSADAPEVWIFGILGSPHLGHRMNAKGVRAIIDVNLLTHAHAERLMVPYESLGMGLCLTLRWKDPLVEREEKMPPPEVADAKLDILIEALNSPQARSLGDRLWVQFYNEVTGGPGVIRDEAQADLLFGFASRAATRIREEAPHVRIAGPGLTGVDVLDRPFDALPPLGKRRRAGLERCLRWSIEHADAVDLHLHAADGDWARRNLEIVRAALAKMPGGTEIDLVSWEWSCARHPNRDDPQSVRQALDEIWAVMTEFNVKIAAYACYYPPPDLGDIYLWANVVDDQGQRNEPVYSFLVEKATAASDTGGETEPELEP